jgi:hypothetical protein
MKHLTEEQLFALVDGGVAPNEEGSIRSHVSGCAECRTSLEEIRQLASDLAPEAPNDEDAHVQRVMSAIEVSRRTSSRAWRRPWLPAGATAVALAAAMVLFIGSRHRESAVGEFTARGTATEATLARDVGVRVFAGERQPMPLSPGAVVGPDTAFTAAYTNLHPRPAYLLLFAVDSGRVVHWLYPAYTRADENPASVLLERTEKERLLPTSVVLDAPAEGRLRLLSIVTEAPLHVADIERRHGASLERESLARDFGGSVTELTLEVRSTR